MTPDLLLETCVKATGIVAIALAATGVLQRRSAAMRHWILAAALMCAGAAPVLERVVPAWHVPAVVTSSNANADGVARQPSSAPSVAALLSVSDRRASHEPVPASGTRIATVILRVWIVGAILSVLTLVAGLGRLAWIASRAQPVHEGTWFRIAGEASREYGLRRRVRLLQSVHPTFLATWGWWRPCILLPRGAHGWSDDRVRIVLLHELAHIARGDWAIQVFAEIVRSAYWFNPLVWVAGRRLQQESERAADDAVLSRGIDGRAYASELLTLARAFGPYGRLWVPAPGIARASMLERRVTAMLNASANRRPLSRIARLATAVALSAVAVAIASAQVAFSSFSGAVYDPLNGLLPNVKMTLTNDQTSAKYEIRSDGAGRFEFVGLPPGRYALETERMGFMPLHGTLDISGQNVQRDVRLEIGSLQETVSVSIPRPGDRDPEPSRSSRPRVWASTSTCTAPATPAGIGGYLTPPNKIGDAHPRYPAHLAAAHQGGTVVLDARIGEDGTIREVRTVSSTHPDFEVAAADAIRQWEFSQTLLNCVPVEVAMTVTVNFIAE